MPIITPIPSAIPISPRKNILITLIEIAKNLLSSATINANSQPIAFTNVNAQ